MIDDPIPSMTDDPVPFNRGAIHPMQCLREGWQIIKEQYWLFVGITLVGSLIAGAGPMGILAGPMVCGMFYCVFLRANNREVNFGMLFKGFDYFVPCLVPALMMTGIAMFFLLGGYVVFLVGMFATMGALGPQRGGQPQPAFFWALGGMYVALILYILVVVIVLRSIFFFAFPLIMDRGLSGWDAVKLSFRAMRANLGGVIGVLLLLEVLSLAASLLCCVGPILELPVNLAMLAVAYRQVFPQRGALGQFEQVGDLDDEPRPSAGQSDTGIRPEEPA